MTDVGRTKKCNFCSGTGKVTIWDRQAKKYIEVKCTVCNGKGRVHLGTI